MEQAVDLWLSMKVKEDSSFRIVIDKRIVRAFDRLPEKFTIKELYDIAGIPDDKRKSMYDVLERLISYGLLKKSRDKEYWNKETDYKRKNGFLLWLQDYYAQVMKEVQN